MAQTEDTELRDLVIEALEKNGSLAKIRALLRANIFLVFEDEGQSLKQNVSLDNILKLPEGSVCFSIIHEFLEFCNLKNTLFVYMAESRQGSEYIYEGRNKLGDKLNVPKNENSKEPILVTLLKQAMKSRKYFDQNDANNLKNYEKTDEMNINDQNCTYIVHEDTNSSATSNSQSDNSSDEKNKLHLRLQLDNSDTDTSSDSVREKSSSEYIPSEHIIAVKSGKPADAKFSFKVSPEVRHIKQSPIYEDKRNDANYFQELKLANNSSSESTSYIDLKPYNPLDEKLLNTTGVPIAEIDREDSRNVSFKNMSLNAQVSDKLQVSAIKTDSLTESISSISLSNEMNSKQAPSKTSLEQHIENVVKSDLDTAEYSNDFMSSSDNKNSEVHTYSPKSLQISKEYTTKQPKNSSFESSQHSSQSSQSSISISDVADLISERSSGTGNHNNDYKSSESKGLNKDSKMVVNNDKCKLSDDSAEFSESPVPSVSNLSLDIHSD